VTKLAPPFPPSEVEPVLQHLERLTYWSRRVFFHRRIPNQYPRFYYKYFPADPDNPKSMRNLRDVLVESRFWLADHERFNDPFDLKANVVFMGTKEQKEARLKSLIASQNRQAGPSERGEILAQMMARSDGDWNLALQEIFRRRAKEIGVCSFSAASKPFLGRKGGVVHVPQSQERSGPRNILMWAHYGRNHEGVCLQFETVWNPRVFTRLQEVQYSQEYPVVDYVNDFERDVLTPLVRKHKGWGYENEWRILHITGVGTYLPFSADSLRRVIFGCRARTEVYGAVEALLAERAARGRAPVKLFRAVQHPTDYKLLLWSLCERA